MSHELLFRCSSIGELMTEPTSVDPEILTPELEEIIASKKRTDEQKAALEWAKVQSLSTGGKTHVRTLLAQAILSVDFDVGSKEMSKGIQCEDDSIALLNHVLGLNLRKNTERKCNEYLTGECDLWDAALRIGRDIKTAWSAATFPILFEDVNPAAVKLYNWQMRGYMWLWDAVKWHVDYCLVDTPEELVRNQPLQLHVVNHIPAEMRVTSWCIERDKSLEVLMAEKVKAARRHYRQAAHEFDRTHRIAGQRPEAIVATVAAQAPAPAVRTVGPAEFAAAAF